MSTALPPSPIQIFTTLAAFREWRRHAYEEKKSVGFVPTMGALHEGHLALVRRSLAENDLTALSIFVNPAQFAPHEDLATYPRTFSRDIEVLSDLSVSVASKLMSETPITRTPDAIFLPSVQEMYPSGISQDTSTQKGTFVEVKGYGHQMEGASRPTFFRGVATVVTKLFNAIEPTNAYFGQKDIQQALLLRRLCRDLLLGHPDPEHLHIVPTARDPNDNLALSSRNTYLMADERKVAGTLYAALSAARAAWDSGLSKEACIKTAIDVVEVRKQEASQLGLNAELRLDYIEMNDSQNFEVLEAGLRSTEHSGPVILSGALWVGKTRLIDNLILGDVGTIIS